MAEARIRAASVEDIEPAYAVLEACKLGPWFELGFDQFRDWWWPTYARLTVAEEKAVIGFSAAREQMIEVYVRPEFRRRGIGSRLLAAAESAVEGPLLEATSRRDELAAVPFLAGQGYERCAARRG